MSYYKSAGMNITDNEIIISNFEKGVHFNKTTRSKQPLNEGFNKYNKEIFLGLKECYFEFRHLTSVQLTIIDILKLHKNMNEVNGTIGNLYKLVKSNKAICGKLKALQIAVKRYEIRDKYILDAFRKNIEITNERIDRCNTLVNSFAKECGLDKVIKLIEEEKGVSFAEDIDNFVYDKYNDISMDRFIEGEDHVNIRQTYINGLMAFAQEHNISILEDVSESLKKHNEIRRAMVDDINENNKLKKKIEKTENGLAAITNDNALFQRSLTLGLADEKFSLKTMASRQKFVDTLKDNNGLGYYVATIHGTKGIKYINDDFEESSVVSKIHFFQTEKEAREVCENFKKENPDIPADVCKITMDFSLNKKEQVEGDFQWMDNHIRMMQKTLRQTEFTSVPDFQLINLDNRYAGEKKYFICGYSLKDKQTYYLKKTTSRGNDWTLNLSEAKFFDKPMTLKNDKEYICKPYALQFTGNIINQFKEYLNDAAMIILDNIPNGSLNRTKFDIGENNFVLKWDPSVDKQVVFATIGSSRPTWVYIDQKRVVTTKGIKEFINADSEDRSIAKVNVSSLHDKKWANNVVKTCSAQNPFVITKVVEVPVEKFKSKEMYIDKEQDDIEEER